MSWTLDKSAVDKIDGYERNVLRGFFLARQESIILRIKGNEEIYQFYQNLPASMFIKFLRLKKLCHVDRMVDTRVAKRLYGNVCSGGVPTGDKTKRWDNVASDPSNLGFSMKMTKD